jgi:hypothetical protein
LELDVVKKDLGYLLMVVVEVGSAYLIKVIFVITYAIMDIKSIVNNSAAIQYQTLR